MISTLMADPDPQRPITARSRVRVSRPPHLDPPYDDERDDDRDDLPGALRHSRAPSISGRHGLADAGSMPTETDIARVSPDPGATGPSEPDRSAGSTSTRAAMAYVRLCIEVLNGYRPPSHLRRLGGPVEFVDVVDQLRRRHNGLGRFRSTPNAGNRPVILSTALTPVRAVNTIPAQRRAVQGQAVQRQASQGQAIQRQTNQSQATQRQATQRQAIQRQVTQQGDTATAPAPARNRNAPAPWAPVNLVRLRISEPLDGIAEAVAVLSQAGSSCAMALRLERTSGTWICALVQVI